MPPGFAQGCLRGEPAAPGVERIDLHQLHVVDPRVPLEESVGALAELQREGKIRHIGVCNLDEPQLARACSDRGGRQRPEPLQPRGAGLAGRARALRAGRACLIAWAPLAKGFLSVAGARWHGSAEGTAPRRARSRSPGCCAALPHSRSPGLLPAASRGERRRARPDAHRRGRRAARRRQLPRLPGTTPRPRRANASRTAQGASCGDERIPHLRRANPRGGRGPAGSLGGSSRREPRRRPRLPAHDSPIRPRPCGRTSSCWRRTALRRRSQSAGSRTRLATKLGYPTVFRPRVRALIVSQGGLVGANTEHCSRS